MADLNGILDKIDLFSEPLSIFMHGSQERGDNLENSDFDIGVLISKDKYLLIMAEMQVILWQPKNAFQIFHENRRFAN